MISNSLYKEYYETIQPVLKEIRTWAENLGDRQMDLTDEEIHQQSIEIQNRMGVREKIEELQKIMTAAKQE